MSMIDELFSLAGRIAVVTGASSGLGRAMAGFLARAGADVVLVARRAAELERTAAGIDTRVTVVAADLLDRTAIEATACQCLDAFGRVDIVVNAAGVNLRQAPAQITPESWDATVHLNLAAPFFFSREFVPGMGERGYGRIINIASLQSVRAFPNGLAYGVSKGGVCQLTRAMAEAWSRHGIACNAIAPGFFPTELTRPVFDDPESERWAAAHTAIGRNGRLDDLAGITVFLAAPASGYITGQTVFVDGGFTAK